MSGAVRNTVLLLPVAPNMIAQIAFFGPDLVTRDGIRKLIEFLELSVDTYPVSSAAERGDGVRE